MKRACAIAVFVTLARSASAQAPPVAPPAAGAPRQSITSTTTAILVDAVVRDRNGRPLTDLAAGDFEVVRRWSARRRSVPSRA